MQTESIDFSRKFICGSNSRAATENPTPTSVEIFFGICIALQRTKPMTSDVAIYLWTNPLSNTLYSAH